MPPNSAVYDDKFRPAISPIFLPVSAGRQTTTGTVSHTREGRGERRERPCTHFPPMTAWDDGKVSWCRSRSVYLTSTYRQVNLFDSPVLDKLLSNCSTVAGQDAEHAVGHAGFGREETKLE